MLLKSPKTYGIHKTSDLQITFDPRYLKTFPCSTPRIVLVRREEQLKPFIDIDPLTIDPIFVLPKNLIPSALEMQLHKVFAFAFSANHYRVKARWSLVFDTWGIQTTNSSLERVCIELYSHLKGYKR